MTDQSNQEPERGSRRRVVISETMPEVDRQPWQTNSGFEKLDSLWPDSPGDARKTIEQLRGRRREIENWFNDDARRFKGLATNPKQVMEELAAEFRVDADFHELVEPDATFVIHHPARAPLGTRLLMAVWQWVGSSRPNLKRFISERNEVIIQVAKDVGASENETNAVMDAFELAGNAAPSPIKLIAAANALRHRRRPAPSLRLNPEV